MGGEGIRHGYSGTDGCHWLRHMHAAEDAVKTDGYLRYTPKVDDSQRRLGRRYRPSQGEQYKDQS